MTHTLQLDKWDDQELNMLFTARLPVLSLPGEFAEQLTKTVFDEISRHVATQQDASLPCFEGTNTIRQK